MHTVIILNKHSSDLLKDFKFLFKPFVDEGIVSFCDWNESGTDVKTSVPDLYRLIKGKPDWRAVVIDTDSMCEHLSGPVADEKNPFDFPTEVLDDMPRESNVPMVRLAHMICGYPTAVTKNFVKGFEFFDPELNGIRRIPEEGLTETAITELEEHYGELKSIYMEEVIPEEIIKAREALVEKYDFTDVRPRELIFVGTRKHRVDEDHIYASWKTQLEMSSSNFCERNNYPTSCRFVCYSITNRENSRYMRELIEFWLSVLTLAINRVSASTLQAYKLYRLSVDISNEELGDLLNKHLNKMETAYSFIQERLRVRPEYSFAPEDNLVPKQEIPVIFEGISGRELYMETKRIGLSRDCPEDELKLWNSDIIEKKKEIAKYMKAPRRAIDKASQHLKSRTESFYGDEFELDEFQVADLQEEIDRLEQEVLACDTRSIIDYQKIKSEMEDVDREVKKDIAFRMSKNLVIGTGLAALFVYMVGFFPYLINSMKLGGKEFQASLLLVVGALTATAMGGLIALFILRHRMIKSMERFNSLVKKLVNGVNASAHKFEEYFSIVCSYMKAQSVFAGIRLKKDSVTSSKFLLRAHKQALKVSMERDEELLASYGIRREPEPERNVTTFFNEAKMPKDNLLYFYETCKVDAEIPINNTGDLVRAPYKFISKFKVEREDIFEEAKGEH